MPDDLTRRRAVLTTALAVALLDTPGKPPEPETLMMREWLDNWTGLGHVVTGMQRQDYDLQLTRHDGQGWTATFYVTGLVHSLTSATGTGSAAMPWRAVQLAAWDALTKTPSEALEPVEDVILP